MKKSTYERIVLILFLVIGTVMLQESLTKNVLSKAFTNEYSKPYDIPLAVILIAMILCLFLLVQNFCKAAKERKLAAANTQTAEVDPAAVAEENLKRKKVGAMMAMIIAYVPALYYLGFNISTGIFVFVCCLFLPEKRSIGKSALTTIGTLIGCYLVFNLLFGVKFPSPF